MWDLTWRELDLLSEYKSNEIEREWDIARTLGTWTISPYSKKKLKPSDLLKLPSEKPIKPSTQEQFEEALRKYGSNSETKS